jgi:hypothetical protein
MRASLYLYLSEMQIASFLHSIILSSWPGWLYHIFSHYFINGKIFGKTLLNIKCVSIFSALLFKTLPIMRSIQWDIIINVHRSSWKVPLFLVRFCSNLIFINRFSKNPQIKNLMKIRPVGAELVHADRQTDRLTDRQTWRTQFCESACKLIRNRTVQNCSLDKGVERLSLSNRSSRLLSHLESDIGRGYNFLFNSRKFRQNRHV